MAANLAGMCNGLIDIGFTLAAATEITTGQGYDNLTAIAELTDDTVTDLISTIHKPGGMVPNPAVSPIPPHITNPGINVGHRAVTNLKLDALVARPYQRTSRLLNNPVAVLAPKNIPSF
jgi:hypothetical protein